MRPFVAAHLHYLPQNQDEISSTEIMIKGCFRPNVQRLGNGRIRPGEVVSVNYDNGLMVVSSIQRQKETAIG